MYNFNRAFSFTLIASPEVIQNCVALLMKDEGPRSAFAVTEKNEDNWALWLSEVSHRRLSQDLPQLERESATLLLRPKEENPA